MATEAGARGTRLWPSMGPALVLAGALVAVAAIGLDLSERFTRFAARHEQWELDEIFPVMFVLGSVAIVLLLALTRELRQEVDRRRHSEEASSKNSSLIELAQKGSGAGRWELDLTGMNLAFCDHSRQMLGLGSASGPSVTTDWIGAVDPEDRPRVWYKLCRAAEAGSTFAAEYRVRMSDGSVRWIETIGDIVSDPGGGARRISGLQFDITVSKLASAKLREMENQLIHLARVSDMTALASSLAHELNQPFTAISNYARGCRRLLHSAPGSGCMEEGLAGIEDNAVRAGEIIRRLRNMIETGEVKREPVQLAQLAAEANALACLAVPAMFVLNEQTIADDLVVEADPIQIQQVLFNLMRNALEAMEMSERRELTIAAERKDGEVIVRVADTGCGLSEERRGLLFQPFSSGKEGGLGVGLSICRTIIERHGGHMWAEDAESGTCFCFSLPDAAAAAQPEDASAGPKAGDAPGERV